MFDHCSPDISWWKGQNMRTRQVGMFPSEMVESGLRRGRVLYVSVTTVLLPFDLFMFQSLVLIIIKMPVDLFSIKCI